MAYRIDNHRLIADGAPVPFRQTPHGGEPMAPRFLVLHYTASLTMASAVTFFLDKRAQASAHLVVDRDGRVTQLMTFDRVAWHAGKSVWKGLEGLNRHSIGIEMVNAGKLAKARDGLWHTWSGQPVADKDVIVARHRDEAAATGWQTYTATQIEAVTAIGAALAGAYGLKEVLGHEDIAPRRKIDPGPAFPLKEVAARILA